MMINLHLLLTGLPRSGHISIEASDSVTVGSLAKAIALAGGAQQTENAMLRIDGRTGATLRPTARLLESDIRSGDAVEIVWVAETGDGGLVATETPAYLRFLSGEEEGAVFALRDGVNTVGRDPSCDVVITDDVASRSHLAITIGEGASVADLGSLNGTIVNGSPLVSSLPIGRGDTITIGSTSMSVELTGRDTAAGDAIHIRFNRPPRVVPPYSGREYEIPAPPDDPPRQRLPLIASIAPVLLAVVMYLITQNVATILFMALSPVMMLGSYFENKVGARRNHREQLSEWRSEISTLIEDLTGERRREVDRRNYEAPAPDEVRRQVQLKGLRVFERAPHDGDFLDLRVGMAELPSRTSIKLKDGGSRDLRSEVRRIPDQFATVPDVPLVSELLADGGIGLAGPADRAYDVARAITLQAAALHSPAELVIAAAVGGSVSSQWSWLRWLPHVQGFPFDAEPLVNERDDVLALIESIRLVDPPKQGDQHPKAGNPHVLLVLDETTPIERKRIVPFLKHATSLGVSFIWVGEDLSVLPRPCGTVVEIPFDGDIATVSMTRSGEVHGAVALDRLSVEDAADLARQLSPLLDDGHPGSARTTLPSLVTIPALLGEVEILSSPAAISERWAQSRSSASRTTALRAPVGVTTDAPFSIDIREVGPHALVAGTTGAGKSEFLQSWVLGLAANHPPDRLNFLFVDYKGGSAFKECVDLPHAVGMVTDLDSHQVRRALTSLEAELRRRSLILKEADCKDLVEMESKGHPTTPPNLFIMVDEFAALAREVPEFVDGVVNIAQRGRSLGLHLVLATQRPAGVVTDNIRANTNLRIALRVADAGESEDVVGAKDAAAIEPTTPGRGVARVGPRGLISFQSAYAGAITRDEETGPTITIDGTGFGRPVRLFPRPVTKPKENTPRSEALSDLERLVGVIDRAHRDSQAHDPRRPWLDPLPDVVDLAKLGTEGTPDRIVIGLRDEPEDQRRSLAILEPEREGSYLILGTGGSGKTSALRTIAASLAQGRSAHLAEVHGIDYGGRGLQALEEMPIVGSIIQGGDVERTTRLLLQLESEISDRVELLASARSGSLSEYRTAERNEIRRVFVLVDGLHSLLEAFEKLDRGRWLELLPGLVATGRQAGIHFIFTADRRSGIPAALASQLQRTLVLRLATDDDYLNAAVPKDMLNVDSPPGRSLDGRHEIQIGIPGGSAEGSVQARAIASLGAQLRGRQIAPVAPIRSLPQTIRYDQVREGSGLAIGIADATLDAHLMTGATKTLAVFGPPGSGKTNALVVMAAELRRAYGEHHLVFVNSRRAPLQMDDLIGQPSAPAELSESLEKAAELLESGERVSLLIDDLLEFDPDEVAGLSTVLGALRRGSGFVAVAADSGMARRVYSEPLTEIRSGRSGLLLQPDFSYDPDLLSVAITRPGGRNFPVGRGFVVDQGMVELVQVYDGITP